MTLQGYRGGGAGGVGGYNVLIVSIARDSRCAGSLRSVWRRGGWGVRVICRISRITKTNWAAGGKMATRLTQIGQTKCSAVFCIGNYDGFANEKPLCRREAKFLRHAIAPYPGSALHRVKVAKKTAK